MTAVGIDLGNLFSTVAAAQKRGIDVLANETSKRQTPSLVAIPEPQEDVPWVKRESGESAQTQLMRNIAGTAGSLKRLVGRKFSDGEVNEEVQRAGFRAQAMPDGSVGMMCPDGVLRSVTELLGQLLAHLKHTAQVALEERDVRDVVISVPGWYTDAQRRAVMDAASIANVNAVRLFEEHAATALAYGIYKKDLPDPVEMKENFKPIRVMFVDIGESDTSVCVAALQKGKLSIEAVEFERNLGGRNFDDVIVDHFVEEFGAKYKLDLRSNKRAMIRLRQACEKLKKVLNTVPQAPINVECIMEDTDVAGSATREEMFEWCAEAVARIERPVRAALERLGMSNGKDLFAVEIVGGSSRFVPLQNKLKEVLEVETLNTTLNADESVARGCALQAAILSPVFRVRDFAVEHTIPYSVELGWHDAAVPPDAPFEETISPIFASDSSADGSVKKTMIPAGKKGVTTYRQTGIRFVARYTAPDALPQGVNPVIGIFTAPELPPVPANYVPSESGNRKITAKLEMDLSGIFRLSQLCVHDTIEVEVKELVKPAEEKKAEAPTPAAAAPEAAAASEDDKPSDASEAPAASPAAEDVDMADAAEKKSAPAEPQYITKTVKKTKVTDVPFESQTGSLSIAELNAAIEREGQNAAADRLAVETSEARNAVEEYVYNMRDNVAEGGALQVFMPEADRQKFLQSLQETEDWLYGEGENQTKSVYVNRLKDLKKIGDPAKQRSWEQFHRFDAVAALRSAAEAHRTWATTSSSDPKYDHLTDDDRSKVINEVDRVLADVEKRLAEQDAQPKDKDPVITVGDIERMKNELNYFVMPIMNKPKPKPLPKKEEPKKADAPGQPEGAGATAENAAANGDKAADEGQAADSSKPSGDDVEMDLD